MTESAPAQRPESTPDDSAPNWPQRHSSPTGGGRADLPPRDDVSYLLLDDQWRIIAADEQNALTGGGDAAQLVGQHARDALGDEALAALRTHGGATFILDEVEYALTLTTFATPTGMLRLVRVQETQATLERILSLIVHEVRNPLMAMRALAQGLAEDYADAGRGGANTPPDTPTIGAYTGRLIGEIDRLGRLLASMAQVARPGERPLRALDPAIALDRAAAIFSADLERRGVTLRVHVTPHTTAILADADQLQQALVNLITNALEAMPQGGALTLRARLDPRRRPVIQVEDTGVGMTPDAIERAFRPRQSAHTAHSSKPGGMGLGLVVVGSIVRQHHGQLRVVSAPGQGTTISITFPRVETT